MNDKDTLKLRRLTEKFASCLRKLFQIEVPVLDIHHTVTSMGGHLIYDIFHNEFCECTIEKTDDKSFAIYISPSLTKESQNFRVAKALGWLFIHMGFVQNPTVWNAFPSGFSCSIPMEFNREGEEFASAFLMPKSEFLRVAKEHRSGSIINTKEIAAYFHVTRTAAANRGYNLGIMRTW